MHNVIKRLEKGPSIPDSVFIAENAVVIGDVSFGENSSIWYNVVVRGDVEKIELGYSTNVQDGTIIHVTKDLFSTHIGNYVSIGHNAVLHGCFLGNNILVGIGAIILDDVELEGDNLVAAGSVLPPGKKYPEGTLVKGSPAKSVRDLKDSEIQNVRENAERYVKYKDIYLNKTF